MNQSQLREYLDRFVATLDRSNRELLDARLQGLVSVFPFNEYEYILMFLLGKNVIRFEQYEKLRDTYVSAVEYQIGITDRNISHFDIFRTQASEIVERVLSTK